MLIIIASRICLPVLEALLDNIGTESVCETEGASGIALLSNCGALSDRDLIEAVATSLVGAELRY